jgi:hypothetical protein
MINGGYDNALRTWLAKLPTDRITYVSPFVHEPDVKIRGGNAGFTAAQVVSAHNRAASVIREFGNPMIKSIQIFGLPDSVTHQCMGNPDITDLFGFDPYRANRKPSSTSVGYNQVMGGFTDLKSWSGKGDYEIGIPEIGIGVNNDGTATSTQLVNWLSGGLQACVDAKAAFVCYFEARDSYMEDIPAVLACWNSFRD